MGKIVLGGRLQRKHASKKKSPRNIALVKETESEEVSCEYTSSCLFYLQTNCKTSSGVCFLKESITWNFQKIC